MKNTWWMNAYRRLTKDLALRHSLLAALIACTVMRVGHLLMVTLVVDDVDGKNDGHTMSLVILFGTLLPFAALLALFVCGWRSRWNTLQAVLLGALFAIALPFTFVTSNTLPDGHWKQEQQQQRQTALTLIARYTVCITLFHYGEYIGTALTARNALTDSSYLLDHSLAYWLAALASWLEFALEYHLIATLKQSTFSAFGMTLTLLGDLLRKRAMFDARGGFTHVIATRKRPTHRLTTTGVYSLVRHPGYLGWTLWAVGTQLILCNPLCTLVYAWLTWKFFDERITREERYLRQFFGPQYAAYQRKVPLGIPLISGYSVSDDSSANVTDSH